ncbi:MAG: hypothetical protein NTZ16_08550 [Verrucomicrobia bacterium]|nr:hypothetical protein [Verrucomicrobiota bacterium]
MYLNVGFIVRVSPGAIWNGDCEHVQPVAPCQFCVTCHDCTLLAWPPE